MSMNGNYRRCSPRLLHALQRDPELVRAIIDFDPAAGSPGYMPAQTRQMLEQLPADVREKVAAGLAVQLQQSGLVDQFSQLAADARRRLSDAGLDASDVGDVLGIEKAWDGLHWLLAGTQWQATEPPGNVVLGGREIGQDLGYGPARFLGPDETARAALALQQIDESKLEASFDANEVGLKYVVHDVHTGYFRQVPAVAAGRTDQSVVAADAESPVGEIVNPRYVID